MKLIHHASQHLNEGIRNMQEGRYKQGLESLSLSEKLLESASNSSKRSKSEMILLTLLNTASCLQQLGRYPESLHYLDACLYNIHHKRLPIKDSQIPRMHLQMCAMHSQLAHHQKALEHARVALSLTLDLFEDKTKEFMQQLAKRKATLEVPKLESRSILGVDHSSNWVYSFSISEVVTIGTVISFTPRPESDLYRVCLLVICYFSIATELKAMAKDYRSYKTRAFQLSLLFLPKESELFQHVRSYLETQIIKKQIKQRAPVKAKPRLRTISRSKKRAHVVSKTPEVDDREFFNDVEHFRNNFAITSDDLYGQFCPEEEDTDSRLVRKMLGI